MEDKAEYGPASRPRSCETCLKRGICMIKQELNTFLLRYGPCFEETLGWQAQVDWAEFLGGRCREYEDGRE